MRMAAEVEIAKMPKDAPQLGISIRIAYSVMLTVSYATIAPVLHEFHERMPTQRYRLENAYAKRGGMTRVADLMYSAHSVIPNVPRELEPVQTV